MGENRGPELAAVLGIFLALTWSFVFLRAYVRLVSVKSWGLDDSLLVISQIFFTVYASCSLSGVKYGTGQHVTNLTIENISRALYYWWLCEIFYTVTTVFVRLAIGVFLLRLCVKKTHKYIIYATLAMVVSFSTFYTILAIFQCSPVSYFWRQYLGMQGSCINPVVFPDASIAHSAVSITADWVLGILPVFMIMDVQLNNRTKYSIALVLSLGILAGIAAAIRIPYIRILAITEDFLFVTTDIAIWSTIEPGLGVIAAAGAALRPLFKTFYDLTVQRSQQRSNARASRMIAYPRHSTLRAYADMDGEEDVELRGEKGSERSRSTVMEGGGCDEENEVEYGHEGIRIERTVVISRS